MRTEVFENKSAYEECADASFRRGRVYICTLCHRRSIGCGGEVPPMILLRTPRDEEMTRPALDIAAAVCVTGSACSLISSMLLME